MNFNAITQKTLNEFLHCLRRRKCVETHSIFFAVGVLMGTIFEFWQYQAYVENWTRIKGSRYFQRLLSALWHVTSISEMTQDVTQDVIFSDCVKCP